MLKVMNRLKSLVLGLGVLSMTLTSCSDDDGPMYSSRTMENSELKTILMQKGYSFNEQGALLLDDLANNTTSLDLSGTGLTDFSGLEVFPNLTDLNLSNNGYEGSFDFAKLPAQITGIDLTGNKLYHYDNLVNVQVAENGDESVTNVRDVKKLYLPLEAKYNISQLMRFYTANISSIENGQIDMQMMDGQGNLQKYNTLRDIPNQELRNYLRENFSDLFVDNRLDISKHLIDGVQKTNDLFIAFMDIDNLEGIQYIVQNPYWEGANIMIMPNVSATLPYMEIPKHLSSISLTNIKMEGDLDVEAENQLKMVYFTNVSHLENFDLSTSKIFGQRDVATELDNFTGSGLIMVDCNDIETILLPDKVNLKAASISLECLPKLRNCDLSKFSGVANLILGDLSSSYELKFPKLTEFDSTGATSFAISKKSYNNFESKVKDFISTYYTNANPKRLTLSISLYGLNNEGFSGYDWQN